MSTSTISIAEQLKGQSFIDPGMISSALDYWFSDNEHIRSPFPESIRKKLAEDATLAMIKWAAPITDAAKKEFNEEMIAERFEEILFEIAYNMVTDEDQKITIKYPFMPRVGDVITKKDSVESSSADGIILKRKTEKRGDHVFLIVEHAEEGNGTIMLDEFELPE
ncbi:hypothetical protein BH09BAC5_BH09BAC5_05770 [soil metagenome]